MSANKEEFFLQRLRDYDIEVVTFTDAELHRMAEVAVADIWPGMQSKVGKKLLDDAAAFVATLS